MILYLCRSQLFSFFFLFCFLVPGSESVRYLSFVLFGSDPIIWLNQAPGFLPFAHVQIQKCIEKSNQLGLSVGPCFGIF